MLFYFPEDGRMGDIIPYYEDGAYKLFYLGFGWSNITTRDQLHFENPFKTGIRGGTGSVIKVDGKYHMFYCKFTFQPYMRRVHILFQSLLYSLSNLLCIYYSAIHQVVYLLRVRNQRA